MIVLDATDSLNAQLGGAGCHRVGHELGKGRTLAEILGGMKMVAEGVHTTVAARRIARTLGVEMPISEQIYQVLYRGKPPKAAVEELMSRTLKAE